MTKAHAALCLLVVAAVAVRASENGAYYECNPDELKTKCVFVKTDKAPFSSVGPHNVAEVIAKESDPRKREVVNESGSALPVSPKPWTEGDKLQATSTEISGDELNYARIFELVAPLRDAAMYTPETIQKDENEWKKLTRAFTDCKIKIEDEDTGHTDGSGNPIIGYKTDTVYEYIKNPNGVDVHNQILQFLEEGAIDLVCLVTELDMSRCDTIRETFGMTMGERNDCMAPAYKALYGVDWVADLGEAITDDIPVDSSTSSNTTATTTTDSAATTTDSAATQTNATTTSTTTTSGSANSTSTATEPSNPVEPTTPSQPAAGSQQPAAGSQQPAAGTQPAAPTNGGSQNGGTPPANGAPGNTGTPGAPVQLRGKK